MAWQTPKTNWVSTDSVTATDMNRIEETVNLLRQAKNVLIVDTEGHFTSDNVEGALHELYVICS